MSGKHKSTKKKARVATGGDKANHQARTNRSDNVGKVAPQSPLWTAQPSLQDAGNGLVALGVSLRARLSAAIAADSAAATAHGQYNQTTIAYDAAYDVWVKLVEKYSADAADITGLGMLPLTPSTYVLAVPLGVRADYDPRMKVIDILVQHAPGLGMCLVEISTDPVGPTTWKQLTGVGLRHALAGYAPGTYWVRAAHVRASAQSDWTSPTAVIVK